ncbi:MAG: hypothetical protein IH845_05555 [Nanoarchaeota archaeon]|nr:hypothetical protein [Nanoarchaeota archaeon]
MVASVIGRLALGVFIGMLIFGIISALGVMDKEKLSERWKEDPRATGFGFFMFTQGLSSTTPAWEVFDKKIQIPYPDSTDILGLFIFAIISVGLIRLTGIKNNILLSWITFIILMISFWFIWKIIMYYAFLWGSSLMGLTYLEASQVRENVLIKGEQIGLPLLLLSLFVFLAGIKLLPHPR